MKGFALGCRTMHDGLVVAAAFLVTGLALLAAGRFLVPDLPLVPGLLRGLGALMLVLAPLILLGTYLRTLTSKPGKEAERGGD